MWFQIPGSETPLKAGVCQGRDSRKNPVYRNYLLPQKSHHTRRDLGVTDQVPPHWMDREQHNTQQGALSLIDTWYKNPRPLESPNPGSFIAVHYIIIFFVKTQATYWKWSAHLDNFLKHNCGWSNNLIPKFISEIIFVANYLLIYLILTQRWIWCPFLNKHSEENLLLCNYFFESKLIYYIILKQSPFSYDAGRPLDHQLHNNLSWISLIRSAHDIHN